MLPKRRAVLLVEVSSGSSRLRLRRPICCGVRPWCANSSPIIVARYLTYSSSHSRSARLDFELAGVALLH